MEDTPRKVTDSVFSDTSLRAITRPQNLTRHFRATKYALSPELDLSPIWDFFLIATVLH